MSAEYNQYLKEHKENVRLGTEWMLENLKSVDMPEYEVKSLLVDVECHDMSKYSEAEYDAYDRYFYGTPDEDKFQLAWLYHQHVNPHHWQYWTLVSDDYDVGDPRKITALRMPFVYVVEMIADWWSFSWAKHDLGEIFKWYDNHKDGIVLHDETRRQVEAILAEMRDLIEAGNDYPD